MHGCTTLVIHCLDFRFIKAIRDHLATHKLLGDCDVVSVAGATKNLVSPKKPTDQEFILRQIAIARQLHKIKQVILLNHLDCGAYGGRAAFPSVKAERDQHISDLRQSSQTIQSRYPDLSIVLWLSKIKADGKIEFEVIPPS